MKLWISLSGLILGLVTFLPDGYPAEVVETDDEEIEAAAELYAMFMHAVQLEDKDLDEAEKVYLAILEKDPDAAYVYYKLALLYWRKGDRESSNRYFELTIEKDPLIKAAYTNFGLAKKIAGDSKGAIELYEKAVENIGDDLGLYKTLADAYLMARDFEKAIDTWKRAAKALPTEPDPWVNAIKLSLALKKRYEAEAIFAEGLEKTDGSNRFLDGVRDVYTLARYDDKADEITLKLLENRPNSARYWRDHIEYLMKKGKVGEAREAYSRAAKYLGYKTGFFVRVGGLFERHGETEAAVAAFEEGLKAKPHNIDLLLALSRLYEKDGNTEKAREYYEKLLRINPDSPNLYIKIAMAELEEGLNDKALETLQRGKEKLPNSKGIRNGIILLLRDMERYDEAETELEEIISLYPDDMLFQASYADLLRVKKDYKKALEVAGKLIELSPTLQTLGLVSSIYKDMKEYGKAAEYYEQAIEKKTDAGGRDYYLLGMLYRKAGDIDKAREAFGKAGDLYEKAISKEPKNFDNLYGLAATYEALGDTEKAREHFEKASEELKKMLVLDVVEGMVVLYTSYADLLQKLDRFDEAEKYYLMAIDKDPANATAMNNLAYMWIEKGENLEKGIEYVKRALEIEPDNSAFLDSLGWGLFMQGKFKEALPELKKAVEAGADGPEILEHLGDAYNKNEMYEEAVAAWEKALEMAPLNADEIKAKIEEARQKLGE